MKKKTLFTSILTIALCLSLIAGSTFALFTSESKTNIAVTSGKVDVTAEMTLGELYSPKGISLDGVITDETNIATETAFANGGTAVLNGNELTLTNITPGDKVNFTITITNNSNVDIKYRTVISHTGDATLFNALDFQIGTDTDDVENAWQTLAANVTDVATLDCSVELPAAAGNTLQGLTCTIIFTVEAVQGNTNPAVAAVSDVESLRTAIANGNNVKLMEDITLDSEDDLTVGAGSGSNIAKAILRVTTDTVIDLNGKTLEYTGENATFGIYVGQGATLTIIDSSSDNSGKLETSNSNAWLIQVGKGAANIYGGNFSTQNNCCIYANNGVINIYGGRFECNGNDQLTLNIGNSYRGEGRGIYVHGGTFKNFEPGVTNTEEVFLADGCTVTSTVSGDDTWYTVVDADDVICINNNQELLDFATAVNNGNTYEGKIVRLKADIDLENEAWTPIGSITGENNKSFNGTFDGNGHTVSNLNVTGTQGVKGAGFFGYVYCGAVKNLTVENAVVTGYSHVAAIVGSAVCSTIDNCHVKNAALTANTYLNGAEYDDGDKVGAIAGYFTCEPNGSVINCTVEDCIIVGYREIGGLVGYLNSYADHTASVVVKNNSVSDVTVTSDKTNNYKGYTSSADYHVAELIGCNPNAITGTNNTTSDVTVNND